MSEIDHVYVREATGPHYVCMATRLGWKCGKCGVGNLGPSPRKGDQCRKCRVRVSEVGTNDTLNIFPDLGFRA